MSESRWAVYFTPRPETMLAHFGRAWFDEASRHSGPRGPLNAGLYDALTARPRLYGFHATLKAPFRLAETETPDSLGDALDELAQDFAPVRLPPLSVASLNNFLALRPVHPCPPIDVLAEACTRALDRLRAPLTDAEVARRAPEHLSRRQRGFLRQWGYPYVFEDYRWHMTLTGQIAAPDGAAVRAYLQELYRAMQGDETVVVDALSLLHQASREHPFELVHRVSLGPVDAEKAAHD